MRLYLDSQSVYNAALLSSERDTRQSLERKGIFLALLTSKGRQGVSVWVIVCITQMCVCMCVELVPPGCGCCQEMTAASVLLTHIFDNQIYRTRQWLFLSCVILTCAVFFLALQLVHICFSHSIRSNNDVCLSLCSQMSSYICCVLSLSSSVKRIFFLSHSNCHIDILMLKS